MFEVHLEWQLPGDPESTKLKIRLLPQPDSRLPSGDYVVTRVEAFNRGYEQAKSDLTNPVIAQPEPFVSEPIVTAPRPDALPTLEPYTGPRQQRNHPTHRDARYLKQLYKTGYSYAQIAAHTRFAPSTIRRVITGLRRSQA